ncbi:MAG: type VII toxin-antitoxin system HepT family RNase toxin [Candidatus Woesearchaeota archaeon]
MEKYSSRIQDKIHDLKLILNQLETTLPKTIKEYESNFVIMAACERFAEKIIEDIINTSNIILKEKGITRREKCFEILTDLKIITNDLAKKLEQMKGMRNLMVRSYDSFDNEVFFESLKELILDTKQYIKQITQLKN